MKNIGFNQGNRKIDDRLFSKGTKEVKTEAQDKNFFSRFLKANNVTFIIGIVGQVLSGLTEGYFTFLATGGALPFFQKSNALPIVSGLFVIFLFEYLGIRVYLVRIVRQAVKKDFKGWQRIALFVFNILFCGAILFANFFTSIKGQQATFVKAKNIDNSHVLMTFDSIKLAQIQAIQLKYDDLNHNLKATAADDKKAINTRYDKVILDLKKTKWSLEDKAEQTIINNEINTKNDDRNKEIEAIQKAHTAEIEANNKLKEEELQTVRNAVNTSKAASDKKTATAIHITAIIEKYSLFLLIIFMSLSILAIIYNEIFTSGAKQDIEIVEVKKRPNLLLALIVGIYNHLYHAGYYIVRFIVGTKSFNYSKFIQEQKDLYSTDIKKIAQTRSKKSATPQRATVAGFNARKTPQRSEMQKEITVSDAEKKAILERYNLNTVQSWYKRSSLVKKTRSGKQETAKRNTDKYLTAKAELEQIGVKFIERKNNVSIKL